ncbi:DAK2 domain-containing protein [Dactylosporangium matsuzakiense]|uniref:Dihydroxyacetone kinase n=1 Tax=Dactylosporangium matsuzakiense TaxID=53360 RepID=A0A9W6KMF0_9ACTN|nr:DAK2 domain-containing protein [Dactylosporangium matsuzakiense]UWZ46307.1 DAK2 domain-containing protein [Dactylosporangium matsuzakiense]GLL02004.1 dihydroxyacetone kinase [Dactylosporangium matsuzakiense]
MPDSVDASAVRRWCAGGLAALRRHQAEIDALNVYPVPDGDTGTNLVLTMSSAVAAATGATAAETMRGAARGALLGAHGNSGIILAQLFKGLATGLERAGAAPVTGAVLAGALDEAAHGAYGAVAAPVEGTVLTVGVAAAKAAVEAATRGGVAAVARAAAQGAREALVRTPEQLPALARAGVVDAGGRGLVVLLDALVETLTGEEPPDGPISAVVPAGGRPGATVARETGSADYAYEVQYLLEARADAVATLRDALVMLGDSLVIVGDEPTWHVHVHVNDVGAAIEAGIEAGRPSRITVTRFEDQVAAQTPHEDDGATRDRAVVVVCSGPGLAALLESEGATVLTGNPSTRQILDAILRSGAERVVVLPNDANVLAVATAAASEARSAGVRAGVVPTRSPVQALAAMAVRDATRRFEDDVIAMAEAAARCRSAELTIAQREALTVAGRCQPGDVLAIVDGEVNLIGQDLPETACLLLDRMLGGGGELVTLIAGRDAPDGLGAVIRAHVEGTWPFVEVQCYEGGQPHYPLLVGVE